MLAWAVTPKNKTWSIPGFCEPKGGLRLRTNGTADANHASISPLPPLLSPPPPRFLLHSTAQVEAQSSVRRRARTVWGGEDRRGATPSETAKRCGKRCRAAPTGVSVALEAAVAGREGIDASTAAAAGEGVCEQQEDDNVDVVVSGLPTPQAAACEGYSTRNMLP